MTTTIPVSPAVTDEARPPLTDDPTHHPVDPAWARPALLALLAATAVLYLWGLGASGWANSFYSAAAQAGSVSWKAFFFGSSDAASSITVDKTPASLWVMALSARIFGVNSWSILVPQALEGVAAVGLLYAAVRRRVGPAAGLLAGAVMALTPVAVLMFRFNNPDALLVLLLVAAAYATLRAVERASTRWLLLASALVGFAFLTKMLQALLVVPALALAYLLFAPTPVRRRVGQLFGAAAVLVASAGWWVLAVTLVPASARPYIGGSQSNSVLELTLGYNGFGRLTGDETGSVGGFGGWGQTGWSRLFGSDIGGQVSWLLPASVLLLGGGWWAARRIADGRPTAAARLVRASLVVWGGWLLVTALTFSYMQGIFHAYYTVALAPAIGALVGTGAVMLWRARRSLVARVVLSASLLGTAWCARDLLDRSPQFLPWLGPTVAVLGVGGAVLLLGLHLYPRRAAAGLAAGALAVALAGPAAYAVDTASTPHTGSIPSAGPAVAGGVGGPGGQGGPGRQGLPGGQGFAGSQGFPGGQPPAGRQGAGGNGGAGGLLQGSDPSADLVALLQQDAASYTWVAAAVGSQNASGYQLATGDPVMPIGGFNGSDPSPTLAQFQALVAAGKIHYFIASGGVGGGLRGGAGGLGGTMGGSAAAQQIASWVASTYQSSAVGGVTVYDLSNASSSGAFATT